MEERRFCDDKVPDVLSDSDLHRLVIEKYNQYAILVFKLLRAFEMEKYSHFKTEYDTAHKSLCVIVGNKEHAKQILTYHVRAERQCYTFKHAEDDKQVVKALELFRGYTETPLMADITTEDAFYLWRSVGSWNGALALAGLPPLKTEWRAAAVKKYIIERASPDILSKSILKQLTPQGLEQLQAICSAVRCIGSYPTLADAICLEEALMQENGKKLVREIFVKLGFPSPAFPETKQSNFKMRSHGWRKSKKYRKLQKHDSQERKHDTTAI